MSQTPVVTPASTGIDLPSPGRYVVDPAHSNAGFTARHLMVSKVRGRFRDFAAEVTVAEPVETSSVTAILQAATLDTNDDRRDGHLRSPDFLDVERYPTLQFRSNGFERTGETTFLLPGELTIRDVTQPVTLDVEYLGAFFDEEGHPRIAFEASTQIDREDFGMTWNLALETGGVLVSKKVDITLEIQAVRAE